jgi:hypothetical protein
MTRFVPVTVLVVVLAAGRVASAQSTDPGTLPGGATISFDMLYIHEDGNPDLAEPKSGMTSLWKYFNMAHCQCSKTPPSGFVETTFGYLATLQNPTMTIDRPLQIWVGSQCDGDVTTRTAMCRQITDQTIDPISLLQQSNGKKVVIPLFQAMNPEMTAQDCTARTQDATIWGIAASTSSGTLDYFVSKATKTDTQAPDLPTKFRVAGGDSAIKISWEAPVSTLDTYAYQALCARADDNNNDIPGKTTGRPTRRYETASTLCGLSQSVDLGMGTDIGATDGSTPVTLSPALKNLDPTFLCGEELSPTATSLRISGLENGVAYKVVLLTIDKFQNAKGTFFTTTVTPVPATDFWEDLHDRDSNAQGGLCLLAETYGDDSGLTQALRAFRDDTLGGSPAGRWLTEVYYATLGKLGVYVHGSVAWRLIAAVVLSPLVVLALLWHALTLPGVLAVIALVWLWRRRRRLVPPQVVRAVAAFATAVVVLAPGRAHAGGYQPYWETNDPASGDKPAAADDASRVTWHAGVRVGPYIPDIDKQLGMDPGPYQQMFHGAQVLPMLDVDRILWTGFGQLGVGGSIGYMQKSENQFADQSDPSDPKRARSDADTNTFRLLPVAVTATYRFTWLDDEYGIPVVPYVRGGLAYYLWWVSISNGNLARACKDGSMDSGCSSTKALGGSLGVQGSIGLAIRAERIDADTANSMRQSGIEHAGIYGELSIAKVNGFGSDTKLSVGDRTWFAGVDFEF